MRKSLFFSSFMKPGKEWGWNGCSVGGWRSFCWWLVELCSEKTVIFAERFVERFFLSVNSCMIGSYLRFEKKW